MLWTWNRNYINRATMETFIFWLCSLLMLIIKNVLIAYFLLETLEWCIFEYICNINLMTWIYCITSVLFHIHCSYKMLKIAPSFSYPIDSLNTFWHPVFSENLSVANYDSSVVPSYFVYHIFAASVGWEASFLTSKPEHYWNKGELNCLQCLSLLELIKIVFLCL